MNLNGSDDDKENVTTSCAKNSLGNVTKLSNSPNMRSRILQKLNKVLTEEGLNLNVKEFLQVSSDEKSKSESNCVIFSEEGENNSSKKELDLSANVFCADIVENILNSIFVAEAEKIDQRITIVGANTRDVKSADSFFLKDDIKSDSQRRAPEKKVLSPKAISVDISSKVGSGEKKQIRVTVKEERDEFLIMEDVDLDVEDVSQASEIEAAKESVRKAEVCKKINAVKENTSADDDDNKEDVEVKSKKKAEEKIAKERESNNNDNVQTKYLWITNIESSTRAADLKKLFSKCGRVVGAKIVTDGWSGCYGYMAMSSKEDADKCLKKFNNHELNGKKLGVSKSKPERLVYKKKKTEPATASKKMPPPPSSTTVRMVKEDTISVAAAATKRKESAEEIARERREMERLAAKKRKLDEDARVLKDERVRQRKIELKNREVQRKLDDEREKLRVEKEQFEKEKCEIMSLERERQRRERERLEREKIELERMKREMKKLKTENEKKTVIASTGSSKTAPPKRRSPVRYGAATTIKRHKEEDRTKQCYGFCSAGSRHSSIGEHGSKMVRKGSDCERPRRVCERSSSSNSGGGGSKLPKSLPYADRSYSTSKEDKVGSFASRGVKRCASPYASSCESSWKQHQSSGGGSTSKSYQQVPKNNWGGEHSWRPAPAAPTPPRMGWSGLGRMNGTVSCGGGFDEGFSARMTSSTSGGIVCPSPPGVTYGGKFDGQGYSHCGRKY